jgi:hypothetical protein
VEAKLRAERVALALEHVVYPVDPALASIRSSRVMSGCRSSRVWRRRDRDQEIDEKLQRAYAPKTSLDERPIAGDNQSVGQHGK